jgi:hypothetical protein
VRSGAMPEPRLRLDKASKRRPQAGSAGPSSIGFVHAGTNEKAMIKFKAR